MTWTVIYTATVTANEPTEGGEYAYSELEWQGESHVIDYDGEYSRMPRVALDNPNVIAGGIIVTDKGSGDTFTVTDLTTSYEAKFYQTWPLPSKGECYINRQQGKDYKTAYVYFNPELVGREVDVTYTFYLSGGAFKWPTIFNGELYFTETGPRNRFLKLVDSTFVSTYSPRVGDYDLNALTVAGDVLYAISFPSCLLIQYSPVWSGYIDYVYGEDVPIWTIAAGLARAADMHLFQRDRRTYLVNRDTPSAVSEISDTNILSINKVSLMPYKKVVFSYDNGTVAVGTGKPEITLDCPFVSDKGLADIIAGNCYNFYTAKNRVFVVEVFGIYEQDLPLQQKSFTFEGKPVVGVILERLLRPDSLTTVYTIRENIIPEFASD